MKMQFVFNNDYNTAINIDVNKIPTEEETQKIENILVEIMDKYEQENEDFMDFDFYRACNKAVKQVIPIAENKVVKTIYI